MTDLGALRAALEAAAAGLPAAAADVTPSGVTAWSRAGIRFAVLSGESVEFRLGSAIAAAAMQTPDTTGSSRGAGWVVFAPRTLDGHALDRLEAWFAAAHRRAAG
ncbi:MAG: hypothetical protein C0498_10345 [Anaerolinea sp.]|nr:hypothetical protein [Anaerolinea sp.]